MEGVIDPAIGNDGCSNPTGSSLDALAKHDSVNPYSANTISALVEQLSPKSRKIFVHMLLTSQGLQSPWAELTPPQTTFKEFSFASETSGSLFDHWHIPLAPPALSAMLTAGFHLPLSVCTSKVLTTMSHNPSTLSWLKVPDDTGVKTVMIFDASVWPAEADMDVESWHNAWLNYPRILARVCCPEIVARFEAHYKWLCGKLWHGEFPTVLEFDMTVRRNYFLTRNTFTVNTAEYRSAYTDVKLTLLRDLILKHEEQVNDLHHTRSNRFHPYDTVRHENDAPMDGDLCLICGENGHRARGCDRTALTNGYPTYSIWTDGTLRTDDDADRKDLCIVWNLRGRPCRSSRCPGKEGHICSFCGSAEHHAGSMRCL